MRIFKTLALVCISISLLFGGLASASMLCCKKVEYTVDVQNSDDTMPCHQSKESKKSDHASQCNDCQSCTNAKVIAHSEDHSVIVTSVIKPLSVNNEYISIVPSGIDNPPKQSS